MTLSAIQAFLKGRKLVPEYTSGELVHLVTRKGRSVQWGGGGWDDDEGWFYEDDTGNFVPLEHEPDVGSACLLGAQAVAMGMSFETMDEEDTFYCHPDFIVNTDDYPHAREDYPHGYVFSEGNQPTQIAQAKYPCPIDDHGWSGGFGMADMSIPIIIAHLNDHHDPRGTHSTSPDKWDEERIIEWLRGLGYNGDHA